MPIRPLIQEQGRCIHCATPVVFARDPSGRWIPYEAPGRTDHRQTCTAVPRTGDGGDVDGSRRRTCPASPDATGCLSNAVSRDGVRI